jgi:predicted secreted protein
VFNDRRSRRIIFVAHCILNQNAKLDRCALYPGAILEVSRLLVESGVGILQIPCPELQALGLGRQARQGNQASIEEEDTRIRLRMEEKESRQVCRQIARLVLHDLEEYSRNGFQIVGLVGVNGSPSCAVEVTWEADAEKAGPGILVGILRDEMLNRGLLCPCIGIRASQPAEAVSAVMRILQEPFGKEKDLRGSG